MSPQRTDIIVPAICAITRIVTRRAILALIVGILLPRPSGVSADHDGACCADGARG